MVDRRPLIDGLTPVIDPKREKEFVYGHLPNEQPVSTKPVGHVIVRVALSTRIRADLAAALKRMSLERQLNAVTPHAIQELLEQALDEWLKNNGVKK